jgi:hypothetical protein
MNNPECTVCDINSEGDVRTPWQCSNERTEDWILVTVVGGHYVTTGATRLVQAEDQHLLGACTSSELIKKKTLHCELFQETRYSKTPLNVPHFTVLSHLIFNKQ